MEGCVLPELSAGSLVGITKRELTSVDCPLLRAAFDQESLSRALSDVPGWLTSARTACGSPGKASALWNPAVVADLLAERGKANRKALATFIGRHFPDWLEHWDSLQEL